MLIDRRVAEFDNETETLKLEPAAIYWREGVIHVSRDHVPGFGTQRIFDYDVSISLEEVGRILDALAHATRQGEGDHIAETFKPTLRSLLQLTKAVAEAP
jgi:hypothetical protein